MEHGKASFEPLTGKGKLFPRGSTCMFKEKVVPCFTRRIKCGCRPSNILKDIFETIDHFNLLPRINGAVPFSILGGHGSWLELIFYSTSTTLLLNGIYV